MLSVRSLSSDLKKKAESELNENEENIIKNVNEIRQWLNENPEVITRRDDQWILTYLRGCKHNVALTKTKLKEYSRMRVVASDLFTNLDPFNQDIQIILNKGISVPLLRTLDKARPTVVIVRLDLPDSKDISLVNIIKVSFMFIETVLRNDDTAVIAGQHVIIDFEKLSIRYILQMTPTLIHHVISCIQYAYPLRVKGFYFLNAPIFFKGILNLVLSNLIPKLAKRIYVKSKEINEMLQEYKPILPVEYGGNEVSIEILAARWKQRFEESRSWFIEMDR